MKIESTYNYIVITADVLEGSPRLEGRRLAVGDVVSWVDISNDLNNYLQEVELSLAQVKECLNYCRSKQCLVDVSDKFCHNCTLRVQQDKSLLDEEQDNWLRAEKLFHKYFPK